MSLRSRTWISLAGLLFFSAALAVVLDLDADGSRSLRLLVLIGGCVLALTGWGILTRGPVGLLAPSQPTTTQRHQMAVQGQAAKETVSQADVQSLFDGLPIPLLKISRSGVVEQSNQSARELLRLAPSETAPFEDLVDGLGRSVSDWLGDALRHQRRPRPEMVHARRGTGQLALQVSLMHPSGALEDGLIAVLSDASELKSLEAQFVQSQKMQAIGQLAGGVAHDFNNLLTAITGYAELMLMRHEQGDPDYGDLIQIQQNTGRAAALVKQLLAFSRKQTLQSRLISINDTLSEVSHLLNRLLGEKFQLDFVYGKDLPPVFVDPRQMEQVILNLVVNARDAMPNGGEVQVASCFVTYASDTQVHKVRVPAGDYVSIAVTDNGCGINADRLDKIFEPFFTTKPVGEGTGLGLSMAYGIIKQTGGFIFAESTEGQGATMTILLPAQTAETPTIEPQIQQTRRNTTRLNGLSVLLVEDEAPVRTFASRALRMHGVAVETAASAEEALELIKAQGFLVDVIVSDVVMPGMDGPTWVRRAMENNKDIKVIFVSGYAEEAIAREKEKIPGAMFLPKPFSLSQLLDAVQEAANV